MPQPPPSKVAVMASIFQSKPDCKDDESARNCNIDRRGKQSLPVYGDGGFSKHKAALKRTNSQRDRFSSAKKMWEKRGTECLNTSNTSISSLGSNFNASIGITPTESEEQKETILVATKELPLKSVNCMNICEKENDARALSRDDSVGTSSASNSCEPLVVNTDFSSIGKMPQNEQSITPPPLPSVPPPTIQGMSDLDDMILAVEHSEHIVTTDAENKDIINGHRLEGDSGQTSSVITTVDSAPPISDKPIVNESSLEFDERNDAGVNALDKLDDNLRAVVSDPLVELERPLAAKDRTDSQEMLLEYADLCESLPSCEYSKVEEEFDRLADISHSDQVDDGHDVQDDENSKLLSNYATIEVGGIEVVEKSPVIENNSLDEEDKTLKKFLNHELKSIEVNSNVGKSCPGSLSEENILYKNETPSQKMNKSTTSSEDGNTSSLGSSLVGQSVSSWLGTPGSVVSAEASCVSADPSPNTKSVSSDQEVLKSSPGDGESSDYVSGNSADLGSSSSSATELGTESSDQNYKIHYLNDGNFWIEGPPLTPTSLLEEIYPMYHPPSTVKFSDSPVRIYSTFTDAEYDRKNEDIDPAAASAEYELEKRVEKMETFEVSLSKGEDGLGLSILGMGVGMEAGVEKLGIFIKTLTVGGAAEKDGRMKVNDQIISVDGSSLVGVTQEFAASVLRNTTGVVNFVVGREKDPGDSEVAKLIRQCVEADMDDRGAQDDSVGAENNHEVIGNLEEINVEEIPLCSPKDGGPAHVGTGKGKVWLEKFSKYLQLGDENIGFENDNKNILGKENDEKIISSVEGDDTRPTTFENVENTPITQSYADNAINTEISNCCCEYRNKYESLLQQYDEAQDNIGQLKRNLSIVTEQLVSRDELFSSHIDRLKEVFKHLEDQLPSKDDTMPLWYSLEPRGALRRKPFIPDELSSLVSTAELSTHTWLDQVIPPTPVLDTSLARGKVLLVHRGTLARRRAKGKLTLVVNATVEDETTAVQDTTLTELNTTRTNMLSHGFNSSFQDELKKKLLNGNKINKPTDKPGVLPTSRASSLPTSPNMSPYSSTSSVQSEIPGIGDSPTEFKREKRRLSGINLWNKARRRLSSR